MCQLCDRPECLLLKEKLCSFIDSVGSEVRPQRKKLDCEIRDLYKCLYKWFIQKCSERVCIGGEILKAQAVTFNKQLSGGETFRVSEKWLHQRNIQHGICQFGVECE
jgi:hypothetical protein